MMSIMNLIAALLFAPLFLGIINRTKAKIGGRRGMPLAQCYFEIWKLLWKGAAISRTTTLLFAAGPAVSLGCVLLAALVVPLGVDPAPVRFAGDFILVAGLLSLGRFMTALAALDTGSSFEGMGASREAWFSSLAEVAFLTALAALAHASGSLSLSGIAARMTGSLWMTSGLVLALAMAACFIVLLAENARIPVDDPATHLELTMVHEVMVLDHGGPDFAFITCGQAVKFWCFCAIVANLLPLGVADPWAAAGLRVVEIALVAVAVGVVESSMARLKLLRVPQLLAGASALALFAILLSTLTR